MTDVPPQNQDQQAPEQQQEQQWSAHPSWSGVLDMFPEGAQRDALLAQIRESDRNAQKAIEQARANQAPEEWQQLIDLARENEVPPADLVDAYNNIDTMREQIAADPDAWLASMKDEIDQAVQSGQLTRKEGAALKRDATQQAAADPSAVDLEDPALAEIRGELEAQRKWREQQEEQARQAQEAADEQAQQQAQQQAVNHFISVFEGAFNGDAVLKDVEPATRHIVANHALSLMQANDALTEEQATQAAIQQFQGLGALPKAPAAGAPVPIGGGSNQQMQQAPAAGKGALSGVDKAREQAMLEALRQAQSAGIQ